MVELECFASVVVAPNTIVTVEVPEYESWVINSVSITPADDLPATGRVVLYASTFTNAGEATEKVALAPLRLGTCEVTQVSYVINCVTKIEFTTQGAAVSVTVSGTMTSSEQLLVSKRDA